MRPRIRPTVKSDPNDRGEIIEHPAFAMAYVGKVSGGAVLMGSEFQHQHYVTLKISGATIHRYLSNDWYHSDARPIIEVAFSESQWQQLTASMNSLETPCTLDYVQGRDIPEIAPPQPKSKAFAQEAREAAQSSLESLKELMTAIEDTKLPQSTKKHLIGLASRVVSSLDASLPFILDQFGEYMEEYVSKAKVEIAGYMKMMNADASSAPQLHDGEGHMTPRRIARGR